MMVFRCFKCDNCGKETSKNGVTACIEIRADLKRFGEENESILDTIRAEYCQECAVSVMDRIRAIMQDPVD